jgi:hypothetical protein
MGAERRRKAQKGAELKQMGIRTTGAITSDHSALSISQHQSASATI